MKILNKGFCLLVVFTVVLSAFLVFKLYPAFAENKEFQKLIIDAENFHMHMLVPPSDFLGNSDKIPKEVANKIIAEKSTEVDKIFTGEFNANRKDLLSKHYSKPLKVNCIDGGVNGVNILQTVVDGNSAKITANAKCYVVYRVFRDDKKYNFKVSDEGTYTYTFVKEGSTWKISRIEGGPDLSKSTNELTLVN